MRLHEPWAIAMSKESIRIWEGPEPKEVTAPDRDQADNIKRAFEACGYELQVQGPFDWSTVALQPPSKRDKS